MRDLVCSECGCKKFYVEYRAFVTDVIINEKREVVEFDKASVELDLNSYNEFCYCVDCGREIDFEQGDYDEDDEEWFDESDYGASFVINDESDYGDYGTIV